MSILLAVANRKGGVGKSTIAAMLAHGFAVWGKRRVLVIDLDTQANVSLILCGGKNWKEARLKDKTVADYLFDSFYPLEPVDPKKYILHDVGDLVVKNDIHPHISLIPGTLDLEEREHALLHQEARQTNSLLDAEKLVVGKMAYRFYQDFTTEFDVVILDCPPGLSFATEAALKVAHFVIVPFRPDFVSQYAVDRIALMIEGKPSLKTLLEKCPMDQRRYMGVVNFWNGSTIHDFLVDNIAAFHPVLNTRIPQTDAVADSFDWRQVRRRIEKKYGESIKDVKSFYKEIIEKIRHTSEFVR
ncbi:MAG: ParA family protein [Nitrososphaera sp.]|nr:ParA family protein [Nitrososphaera sp.]